MGGAFASGKVRSMSAAGNFITCQCALFFFQVRVGDVILEVEGIWRKPNLRFCPHPYSGQPVATEAEARSRIVGIAGTNVQLQVKMSPFL